MIFDDLEEKILELTRRLAEAEEKSMAISQACEHYLKEEKELKEKLK